MSGSVRARLKGRSAGDARAIPGETAARVSRETYTSRAECTIRGARVLQVRTRKRTMSAPSVDEYWMRALARRALILPSLRPFDKLRAQGRVPPSPACGRGALHGAADIAPLPHAGEGVDRAAVDGWGGGHCARARLPLTRAAALGPGRPA